MGVDNVQANGADPQAGVFGPVERENGYLIPDVGTWKQLLEALDSSRHLSSLAVVCHGLWCEEESSLGPRRADQRYRLRFYPEQWAYWES